MNLPAPTVERLSAYRRLCRDLLAAREQRVFSHDLATAWHATPAQVRRDLMLIGYHGSNAKGYSVPGLIEAVDGVLGTAGEVGAALVGVGHLGRALLSYFVGRHPSIEVRAAFDINPERVDRVIHGCRCYAVRDMPRVLAETPVDVGIIAVPAEAAQETATQLVRCGVGALVNFAPVLLDVPPGVYEESIDIAVLLEKAAFFARETALKEAT
jgi:redox-sensing transcriptional repressor